MQPDLEWDTYREAARSLVEQGRGEEAIRHLRLALERAERMGDAERSLVSLTGLAGFLCAEGALDEAEPLYRRALALSEQVLQGEPEQWAEALGGLAGICHLSEREPEAATLLEQAVSVLEPLPESELQLAALLNNLAGLQFRLGQQRRALDSWERAIELTRRALGPLHPHVGRMLENQAAALEELGELAEALGIYREIVIIDKRHYKGQAASSMNLVGNVLVRLEQLDEAREVYEEALDLAEEEYGPQNPVLQPLIENLLHLYARLDLAAERAALTERLQGPEDPAIPPSSPPSS